VAHTVTGKAAIRFTDARSIGLLGRFTRYANSRPLLEPRPRPGAPAGEATPASPKWIAARERYRERVSPESRWPLSTLPYYPNLYTYSLLAMQEGSQKLHTGPCSSRTSSWSSALSIMAPRPAPSPATAPSARRTTSPTGFAITKYLHPARYAGRAGPTLNDFSDSDPEDKVWLHPDAIQKNYYVNDAARLQVGVPWNLEDYFDFFQRTEFSEDYDLA
jgi:hypothetical protein